jgi:hypothetical protein
MEKSKVKTVKDTMDEFFNLFTDEQKNSLIEKSEYENWLRIVKEKNKMPLDKLNTEDELEEVQNIIG